MLFQLKKGLKLMEETVQLIFAVIISRLLLKCFLYNQFCSLKQFLLLVPKYFELQIIHGQIGFPVIERFFRAEKMASAPLFPPKTSVPIQQALAYTHWPHMRRVIDRQQRGISRENSEIFGKKTWR